MKGILEAGERQPLCDLGSREHVITEKSTPKVASFVFFFFPRKNYRVESFADGGGPQTTILIFIAQQTGKKKRKRIQKKDRKKTMLISW